MLVMDKREGLKQESNKEAVFPVDCTIMHEGNLLFLLIARYRRNHTYVFEGR
jgi:hypothetical protein